MSTEYQATELPPTPDNLPDEDMPSDEEKGEISTRGVFFPPPKEPTKPKKPVSKLTMVSSLIFNAYEGQTPRNDAANRVKGYLVDFTINRNGPIGYNDMLYFAFWSSHPAQAYFSDNTGRHHKVTPSGMGSITPWLPLGPGRTNGSMIYTPAPGLRVNPRRPDEVVVTHGVMLKRVRGHVTEFFRIQPANGAPPPQTGHPNLPYRGGERGYTLTSDGRALQLHCMGGYMPNLR